MLRYSGMSSVPGAPGSFAPGGPGNLMAGLELGQVPVGFQKFVY